MNWKERLVQKVKEPVPAKDRRSGINAAWTEESLAFLKEHYPAGMALKTFAAQTRHHIYEVKRKAAQLGLRRSENPPASAKPPLHISPMRFVAVTFDEVVGWLRGHGHAVGPDEKPGLWKVGLLDAQTPQMVVRLANDKRCRDHGLPPFQVDTGGGIPTEDSWAAGGSPMGSSMDLQLAGLASK